MITLRLESGPGGDICDLTSEAYDIRFQQVAWTMRTATKSTAPVKIIIDDTRLQAPAKADPKAFLPPDLTAS